MDNDDLRLYAICWQDTSEPWGWAPAVPEEFGDLPDDLLPNGPFFWDPAEADQALARVREYSAQVAFKNLRERDEARYQRDLATFESETERGSPLPGVSVTVVGEPVLAWSPPKPRPLKFDRDLRESARQLSALEWTIQTYAVPQPRT
jgi:hypothetical protein